MQRDFDRSTPCPEAPTLDQLALTQGLVSAGLRLHSRQMLLRTSQLIEEHAAASGGATIIGCFQRLSVYARATNRYRRLAKQCARLFILGYADVTPPAAPNIVVVPLAAGWPLVEEWCLLAGGPACSLALLARDAEGFSPGRRSRKFHALWTGESAVVDGALARCLAALGLPPPDTRRDPEATARTTLALSRALAGTGR